MANITTPMTDSATFKKLHAKKASHTNADSTTSSVHSSDLATIRLSFRSDKQMFTFKSA